jgi:hypothetical protein
LRLRLWRFVLRGAAMIKNLLGSILGTVVLIAMFLSFIVSFGALGLLIWHYPLQSLVIIMLIAWVCGND